MPAKAIRVLIVSDHPLIREGLRNLIEKQRKFVVCGWTANGRQTLSKIRSTRAQVVIFTGNFVGPAEMEMLSEVRRTKPSIATVFVSMHDETADAVPALRSGARAFLTKSESGRIVEALRRVASGKVFLTDRNTALLASLLSENRDYRTPQAQLTQRELEIFDLVGQGLATSEIAIRLKLSVKTVHSYFARIKEKLGLKTAGQLRRAAFRWSDSSGTIGRDN